MQRKSKILPHIVSLSKPRNKDQRDRLKIQDIYINQSNLKLHKDYRQQQQFTTLKANNFLSRIDNIDSPEIIFNISDHLKQIVKEQFCKENISNELYKFNPNRLPRNSKELTKSNSILGRSGEHKFNNRIIAEERYNAINLAKWMDQKLQHFRKKHTITFMDILQYKQTILNYTLGTIIESLTKKCKEEGQILSLIWNNTFHMFEEVFKVLVQSNITKEKEKISESKELNEIFQTNHQFLRDENQTLRKENNLVFEKMKHVILWNKSLRKDKKTLNTNNRILQYRNITYSQALEQTIQMILKSSPEANLITAVKKILTKLSKEKGRKKHFLKKEVDQQFQQWTKQKVLKWIRDNSYLNDQSIEQINKAVMVKQDLYELTKLDDVNDMNKIDIYDLFKLYDYGVQVSPAICNSYAQSEPKIMKHVEVLTRKLSSIEQASQTYYTGHQYYDRVLQEPSEIQEKYFKNAPSTSKSKISRSVHKNVIKVKQNGKILSKKHIQKKSEKIEMNNDSEFMHMQRKDKKIKKHHNSLQTALKEQQENILQNIRNDNISLNYQQMEQTLSYHLLRSETSRVSISNKTKAQQTSRNGQTFNSIRLKDKSLQNLNDSLLNLQQNHNSHKIKSYRKKSLAYIRTDASSKNVGILKKKKFQQTYKEERDLMNGGKQQFVDRIVRRRSFCMKQRVEFANFKEAEEVSQHNREFMRGSRYFKSIAYCQTTKFLIDSVDKIIKRDPAISNMTKSKTLTNSKTLFYNINASIEQIVRIPPKNKQFVNNSISMLIKYISELIFDYLKMIRREKEDIMNDSEKAIYPLSILLVDRMTCKYGLKDIAQKKIKHFLEKILTFANISEKIELYGILLGLTDDQVGSDELLIYLKCLVYFDSKKMVKDASIESNQVDIEVVRQNIHKVLEYFFDKEYISLLELKLEIYFQENASEITIEGISILIIKELISRKKDLMSKYSKIHWLSSVDGNFFMNIFKMLKMVNNYREMILNSEIIKKEKIRKDHKQVILALKGIKNRQAVKNKTKINPSHDFFSQNSFDIIKIAQILRDLMKRSDIMDEQYGKSLTRERFITAAVLYGLPNTQDIQVLIEFFCMKFTQMKEGNASYEQIVWNESKSVQKLSKMWGYQGKVKGFEGVSNGWQLSMMYSNHLQQQVMQVMGRVGTIGLYVQNSLLNIILE